VSSPDGRRKTSSTMTLSSLSNGGPGLPGGGAQALCQRKRLKAPTLSELDSSDSDDDITIGGQKSASSSSVSTSVVDDTSPESVLGRKTPPMFLPISSTPQPERRQAPQRRHSIEKETPTNVRQFIPPSRQSSKSLVGRIAHHLFPWTPLLLHSPPYTLHPLRSSYPVEVFVLGMVWSALSALCRGRKPIKVCQSPLMSLLAHRSSSSSLLMLPAFLETHPSAQDCCCFHRKPFSLGVIVILHFDSQQQMHPLNPDRGHREVLVCVDGMEEFCFPVECLSLTVEEVMHIRQVLVKADLEKFQQYKDVYNAMKKGKLCFCCRSKRFSLFTWSYTCQFCKRPVCSQCCQKMRLPSKPYANLPIYSLGSTTTLPRDRVAALGKAATSKPEKPSTSHHRLSLQKTMSKLSKHSSLEKSQSRDEVELPVELTEDWSTMEVCVDCKKFIHDIISSSKHSLSLATKRARLKRKTQSFYMSSPKGADYRPSERTINEV
ncbi:unnamed protein product, partial [Oncorhynchus mykiss]